MSLFVPGAHGCLYRRAKGRDGGWRACWFAMSTGYSGTPLAKKLGVKHGHVLALMGAPEAWSIPGLEPEVKLRRDLRRKPDIVITFVRSLSDLRRQAHRLVTAVPAEGSLWVAWPRRAGGYESDVTEQSLRDELLPTGLVDNKVAALDEDWSGLRFLWGRELRASMTRGSGADAV